MVESTLATMDVRADADALSVASSIVPYAWGSDRCYVCLPSAAGWHAIHRRYLFIVSDLVICNSASGPPRQRPVLRRHRNA